MNGITFKVRVVFAEDGELLLEKELSELLQVYLSLKGVYVPSRAKKSLKVYLMDRNEILNIDAGTLENGII